jgi:hypothetical protein
MAGTCVYEWSTYLVEGAPVLVCVEHGGRDLSGDVYFNKDPHDMTGGPCDCSPQVTDGGS